jgi:glycosyltransferase involved in cell wall biosynthesis
VNRPLWFVVPDPRARVTGGNLYNLGLTGALRDAGVDVRVIDRAGCEPRIREAPGPCLVDSLYLEELPRLKATGAKVYLLAHYLPSLVAHGGVPALEELDGAERAALAAADGFVVPSGFMAHALERLQPSRRIITVAPAIEVAPARPGERSAGDPLRAVVIANLVPGKGVRALLDALAPHLRDGARLELTVVGSLDDDPAYARACRERVAAEPALSAAIAFTGALDHPSALARLGAADLLLSASKMESFGLALAEARASGVPIVACSGGNAGAHVDERAGGRLSASADELAAECARLARDPVELDRRRRAAQAARLSRRSWSEAASELVAALAGA